MDLDEFGWIQTDLDGFKFGFRWIYMDLDGFGWIQMDLDGLLFGTNGIFWI